MNIISFIAYYTDIIVNVSRTIYHRIRDVIVYMCAFWAAPIMLLLMGYVTSSYLYLYKLLNRRNYKDAESFWRKPVERMCRLWLAQGQLYHGVEFSGLENIPDEGPALLIFYHSPLPLDFAYLGAKVMLAKKRKVKMIAERDMFQKCGIETFIEALEFTPGEKDDCIQYLNNGDVVIIAPGGFREALFSENYNLIWTKRHGFADVAVKAKVPVIPVFTENGREMVFTFDFLKRIFLPIYETFRIGFLPTLGWFPVKLRIHIGKPIEFDESRTAPQLAHMTEEALTNMIQEKQRLPGSITYALLERFGINLRRKAEKGA